jgi:hypothetical protein
MTEWRRFYFTWNVSLRMTMLYTFFPVSPSLSKIASFPITDRPCGLLVRVPGYRTEMYCDSCEVWTECYVEESRPPLWSSGQSSWLQNRDVLWFLWGMNWIYIRYVEESRPPLWSSGQSSWLQNRDVLWFLWGVNWIYVCYVEESRPPLWSSGQSSWLQIQEK